MSREYPGWSGDREQLFALHDALNEIRKAKTGITINSLITEAEAYHKFGSDNIDKPTVYRFLQRDRSPNLRLKYEVAAPLYTFLKISPRYATKYISVFDPDDRRVDHALFHQLRVYFSHASHTDTSSDIVTVSKSLIGVYEVFRRPWMLPTRQQDNYILRTELRIFNPTENIVCVEEIEKYDGDYGGKSPVN